MAMLNNQRVFFGKLVPPPRIILFIIQVGGGHGGSLRGGAIPIYWVEIPMVITSINKPLFHPTVTAPPSAVHHRISK